MPVLRVDSITKPLICSDLGSGKIVFVQGPGAFDPESAVASCFLVARNSRERPRVGCDGFGDGTLLTSMAMLESSRSVSSTLASSTLLLRSAGRTVTDRPVSLVSRAERDISRASFRATKMRS